MKIIFFSDIHGNKYILPEFLKQINKERPYKVIFGGDIFGYYYHQEEIINIFRKNKFIILLGNHDQYFLDILDHKIDPSILVNKYGNSYKNIINKISKKNISYLKKLKPSLEFKVDEIRFGIFHGSPDNPLEGRIYPDTKYDNFNLIEKYDYVFLGHTHHKMERKIGSTLIINPGSIGQQRDGKGCSYIIFDTKTKKYEFKLVKFNPNNLINEIEKHDPDNQKLIEVLFRKTNN